MSVFLIFLLLFASILITAEEAYIAGWRKTGYDGNSGINGDDIIAYALKFANKKPMYRYKLGGYKLSQKKGEGTDCAGFISLIYAHFGLNTWGKINSAPGLCRSLISNKDYEKVSKDKMIPGDVVFFSSSSGVQHVAIYAGNKEIVHASDENVGIVKTNISYSLMGGKRHISYVVRIVNDEGHFQAGVVKGKRTSYPSRNNPYFFSSRYNAFVGTAFGPPLCTHNCTWYAYGRFAEILGKRPALPTGNAGAWYPSCTAYRKGRTPKTGAVMCWRYSDGGAGHVAVVEEVKANGNVVVSNSGFSGNTLFWMQEWYKSSGYSSGRFIFQGFIYQP